MFTFSLVIILTLSLLLNLTQATEYYQVTITGPISLVSFWTVDSNIVTGIYLTQIDFNSQINNNIITIGLLQQYPELGYNDNGFTYTALDYGISGIGINIYGTYYLMYDAGGGVYNLDSRTVSYACGLVVTTTTAPPKYYQITLTTSLFGTKTYYWSVDPVHNSVIGIYLNSVDFNSLTNNHILPLHAFGNDNQFIYNYPNYVITIFGIGFTDISNTYYNLYTDSTGPLKLDTISNTYDVGFSVNSIRWPLTAAPTVTPTAIPTTSFPTAVPTTATPTATPTTLPAYYLATFSSSNIAGAFTLEFYLKVNSNIITGVYVNSKDYNDQVNNKIIAPGLFKHTISGQYNYYYSDNIFVYNTGAPNYGMTGGGISFIYSDTYAYNIAQEYGSLCYLAPSNPQAFGQYTCGVGGMSVTTTADPTYATDSPTALPTYTPSAAPTYTPTATPTTPTAEPTYTPTTTIPTATPTSAVEYYHAIIKFASTNIDIYVTIDNIQHIISGVYLTLYEYNIQTNNQLIQPLGFQSNDNIFDYTLTYNNINTYGITSNGISFIYNNKATQIRQGRGNFYSYVYGDGFINSVTYIVFTPILPPNYISATPTATPTAPTAEPTSAPTATPTSPTLYYIVTVTGGSSQVGPISVYIYLTIVANLITGMYLLLLLCVYVYIMYILLLLYALPVYTTCIYYSYTLYYNYYCHCY